MVCHIAIGLDFAFLSVYEIHLGQLGKGQRGSSLA